jgi:hypothetical protein
MNKIALKKPKYTKSKVKNFDFRFQTVSMQLNKKKYINIVYSNQQKKTDKLKIIKVYIFNIKNSINM